MSKNIHTDATNKTQQFVCDDQVLVNYEIPETTSNTAEQLTNGIYDKQQSLVEKANNTFRDLCKTLENEQTKLLELEERRKKLQEEMLVLKAEIEQEKQSFNLNIIQSVADNLNTLNNSDICPEDEEPLSSVTERKVVAENCRDILKEEPSIQEHVQYIRSELQNVLSECISEKCNNGN